METDAKGQFSVESFYNVLNDRIGPITGWNSFWNPSVPPRVLTFCLVAKKHKILDDRYIEEKKSCYS